MIEFLTISLVIMLAVISPGSDFVIVTRNALRYPQKIGIMTALGMDPQTSPVWQERGACAALLNKTDRKGN